MSIRQFIVYPAEGDNFGEKIIVSAKTYKSVSYLREKIARHLSVDPADLQLKFRISDSMVVLYPADNDLISGIGQIESIMACFTRRHQDSPVDLSKTTTHELIDTIRKLRHRSHKICHRMTEQMEKERGEFEAQIAEIQSEISKSKEEHRSKVEKIRQSYGDAIATIKKAQKREISQSSAVLKTAK